MDNSIVPKLIAAAVAQVGPLLTAASDDIAKAMADAIIPRAAEGADDKPLKFPVSVRITLKPMGAVGDVVVKVSYGTRRNSETMETVDLTPELPGIAGKGE